MENKEEKQSEINGKEEDIKKPDDINNEKKGNQEKEGNTIEDKKNEEKKDDDTETENKKQNEKETDNNPKTKIDNKDENENNDKNEEKIDPNLIFQKELLNIISKQEKILSATSTINEKFNVSNQITKEQIASFKVNIDKYGKYLLLIKKELGMISDTMRKIKKLSNEKKK